MASIFLVSDIGTCRICESGRELVSGLEVRMNEVDGVKGRKAME